MTCCWWKKCCVTRYSFQSSSPLTFGSSDDSLIVNYHKLGSSLKKRGSWIASKLLIVNKETVRLMIRVNTTFTVLDQSLQQREKQYTTGRGRWRTCWHPRHNLLPLPQHLKCHAKRKSSHQHERHDIPCVEGKEGEHVVETAAAHSGGQIPVNICLLTGQNISYRQPVRTSRHVLTEMSDRMLQAATVWKHPWNDTSRQHTVVNIGSSGIIPWVLPSRPYAHSFGLSFQQ